MYPAVLLLEFPPCHGVNSTATLLAMLLIVLNHNCKFFDTPSIEKGCLYSPPLNVGRFVITLITRLWLKFGYVALEVGYKRPWNHWPNYTKTLTVKTMSCHVMCQPSQGCHVVRKPKSHGESKCKCSRQQFPSFSILAWAPDTKTKMPWHDSRPQKFDCF